MPQGEKILPILPSPLIHCLTYPWSRSSRGELAVGKFQAPRGWGGGFCEFISPVVIIIAVGTIYYKSQEGKKATKEGLVSSNFFDHVYPITKLACTLIYA